MLFYITLRMDCYTPPLLPPPPPEFFLALLVNNIRLPAVLVPSPPSGSVGELRKIESSESRLCRLFRQILIRVSCFSSHALRTSL